MDYLSHTLSCHKSRRQMWEYVKRMRHNGNAHERWVVWLKPQDVWGNGNVVYHVYMVPKMAKGIARSRGHVSYADPTIINPYCRRSVVSPPYQLPYDPQWNGAGS